MSFFNPELEITRNEKYGPKVHPWEKIIKDAYAGTYKYGHNSASNPVYYPPPKKGKVPSANRIKFTVIGTRTAKEYIYCMNLVKGLHKYRWRYFDAPVLTSVTSAEWPKIWSDLKIQHGGEAYCLKNQVAVLLNGKFLGGEKELKELIESKYVYYIKPDYFVEGVESFSNYINSSGRPCAYLEIMIDSKYIGMLIFMLYSDLVPRTCENFLRLCKEQKGGYSGTPVHRIVKDGWIQCGGYGLKNTELPCENFIVPHDRRGVLGMCNDGRHVDCSTQFFVLLQPQDWMAFKYVAFGQLICGDEVLQQLEKVPCWYESPKKNIIIAKANILNMDCQDITINKGTNKYIEGHIENLLEIGEIFYEALLEKVFLEVQFRSLQRIQDEMITQLESEITPEEVAKNLRTTARFMRKKEEIDKQIEKSEADRSGKATSPLTVERGENNDFDVEEYEYQPEEYSYQQATAGVSGSLVVKPEKPYYIPLTDVPFPGEVSSEYDLKRLLQGDYCLEADLYPENGMKKKKTVEEKVFFRPEVLDAIRTIPALQTISSTSSEPSLDPADEKAIKNYIYENVDHESFGGITIKHVGDRGKQNILDVQKAPDAVITDETLRKYRVAEFELKRGREKKVSITLPEETESHREIIRRQTGFVRPEDLTRLRRLERGGDDISEDSTELDDYLPYTRQVSIQNPHSSINSKKTATPRQPIATWSEEIKVDEVLIESSDSVLLDESDEDVELEKRQEDQFYVPEKEKESENKRDSHGVVWKSGSGLRVTKRDRDRRESVLSRLMEEPVALGPGPTLKDYKSASEQEKSKSLFLLTYSPEKYQNLNQLDDDSREAYLWRRHPVTLESPHHRTGKPMDELLFLQHGKKVYRKISTDYVKTIDRIEHKEQTSLRSLEYAKKRPAISVMEYQQKNKEYQENLARAKLFTGKMADK